MVDITKLANLNVKLVDQLAKANARITEATGKTIKMHKAIIRALREAEHSEKCPVVNVYKGQCACWIQEARASIGLEPLVYKEEPMFARPSTFDDDEDED